jgi:hypothetical protein
MTNKELEKRIEDLADKLGYVWEKGIFNYRYVSRDIGSIMENFHKLLDYLNLCMTMPGTRIEKINTKARKGATGTNRSKK